MAPESKHTLDRDMSAGGIPRRLRRLGELDALARSLRKARPKTVAESLPAYGKNAGDQPRRGSR